MNESELAALMLEWERVQAVADALKAEIEAAVLAIGKTVKVGNVAASYSAGRKSYDYTTALDNAYVLGAITDADLEPYREHIPASVKLDARKACAGLKIEDVPFKQSPPSVTVKVG
jgi:hypothetical protein